MVGGCCGDNYESFGNVYSINLSQIRKKKKNHVFSWKKWNFEGDVDSLQRWGAALAACEDKERIYLYGGRKDEKSEDSNSLVCINIKEERVSSLKIKRMPSGRRKPSI